MVQRRNRPSLALKAIVERLLRCLDRNIAPEPRIARAVDLPHAAGTNTRNRFIGAQAHAGLEAHRDCQRILRSGTDEYTLGVPKQLPWPRANSRRNRLADVPEDLEVETPVGRERQR